MKIELLTSAMNDLTHRRIFYENHGEGLGDYFFNSLFSDIDSLALYAGIHPYQITSSFVKSRSPRLFSAILTHPATRSLP